jgi:hypothetical protein
VAVVGLVLELLELAVLAEAVMDMLGNLLFMALMEQQTQEAAQAEVVVDHLD